jgi:hypothetical protein
MMPVQYLSQNIGQVLQEVEAIRDLLRLWRARGGALRIYAASITRDNLNLRVPCKPRGKRFGGPIRQQVYCAVQFQIAQHGSIARPLAQSPIVNTKNTYFTNRWLLHCIGAPKDRGGACWHAQRRCQQGAGITSERKPNCLYRLLFVTG